MQDKLNEAIHSVPADADRSTRPGTAGSINRTLARRLLGDPVNRSDDEDDQEKDRTEYLDTVATFAGQYNVATKESHARFLKRLQRIQDKLGTKQYKKLDHIVKKLLTTKHGFSREKAEAMLRVGPTSAGPHSSGGGGGEYPNDKSDRPPVANNVSPELIAAAEAYGGKLDHKTPEGMVFRFPDSFGAVALCMIKGVNPAGIYMQNKKFFITVAWPIATAPVIKSDPAPVGAVKP